MPQGLCPLPGDFRLATRPGLSQLSQDLPSLVVSSELNRTLTPQTLSAWYFGFSPPSKGGGCQRDGQRNVLTLCVASCQRYFSRACRVTSSSGKWFALGNSHINVDWQTNCRVAGTRDLVSSLEFALPARSWVVPAFGDNSLPRMSVCRGGGLVQRTPLTLSGHVLLS